MQSKILIPWYSFRKSQSISFFNNQINKLIIYCSNEILPVAYEKTFRPKCIASPMFIFQRNSRVQLHKESACLQIHLVQIKLESAS